ncbi:hypothetical protein RBB68_12655 [Leptospira interrogans]|uniref:hypothetical protein n=1 Tax=Leptospira interrogans TaxID=173 RepID=UPI000ADDDB60|nr:hypothetical protein [Leptospira interrogans]WML93252.1 hypothetical protein RBB68_12655 [Leptospira interrogans]
MPILREASLEFTDRVQTQQNAGHVLGARSNSASRFYGPRNNSANTSLNSIHRFYGRSLQVCV